MPHPRVIPHSDGAGLIVATGDGVEMARIGERVWIYRADHRPGMGGAAEYVVVPATCAVPYMARSLASRSAGFKFARCDMLSTISGQSLAV